MDTSGFSQVGRYGTLSLLKRRSLAAANTNGSNPSASPNDLITSFGIDEPQLTFGSTSTCGVRLYYPDVDPLHCQIVFEDGKAFLAVLGKAGVLADGCWVYPHTAASSSRSSNSAEEQQQQQTIIPLSNNSEFEIHNKRFRFAYPPKEVRKALLATPAPIHKRALRLSMIHSAQVFSPRPSKDPRENLRILQSPLKGIFGSRSPMRTPGKSQTRTRAVSPLKFGSKSGALSDDGEMRDQEANKDQDQAAEQEEEDDQEEEEEEIILVQTNHPRVVEEERDLVILEDVPLGPINLPPAVGSPSKVQQQLYAQAPVRAPQPQPPQTPRRKSLGGTALHRAVLIRSAQRAVLRAEKEKEEEEEREEEMEVLGVVVDPVEAELDEDSDSDEYGEDEEDRDVEMRSVSSDDGERTDEEEQEETMKETEEKKPLWRKSLEKIIPWPFTGSSGNEDGDEEQHSDGEDEEQEQEDENDAPGPLPVRPAQTPVRRALGSFMTPQPQHHTEQNVGQLRRNIFPATTARTAQGRSSMAPPALPEPALAAASLPASGPGRYSLGGGEARRVIVQQPWKVKDLVLPPVVPDASTSSGSGPSNAPFARPSLPMAPPSTPMRGGLGAGAAPRATPVVTDEERKAIQERRRSAVREVREDTFWKDGAPGMSPVKSSGSSRSGSTTASSSRSTSTSPVKRGIHDMRIAEDKSESSSNNMSIAMPTPRRAVFGSPTKGRSLGYAIAEEGNSVFMDDAEPKGERAEHGKQEDTEEEEDTRSLLDRMRETVEDMKRRRSVVMATPRVESNAAAAATTELATVDRAAPTSSALATPPRPTGGFGMGSVKKLDFTRITPGPRAGSVKPPSTETPKPPSSTSAKSATLDSAEAEQAADEIEEEEPFSLLRPGTRDSSSSSSRKPPSRDLRERRQAATESEDKDMDLHIVPLPVVVVDVVADDVDNDGEAEERQEENQEKPKQTKGKPRSRPRLLRGPKAAVVEDAEEHEETEEAEQAHGSELKVKSTSKAPVKPNSRSRSAKSPAPVPGPAITPADSLAPVTRRQRSRSKTPQPSPVEDETERAPTRSTGARRTRKGTTEAEDLAPVPTRRGRKAAVEPEHEPEVERKEPEPEEKKLKTPAAKRGRKPRAAANVVEEESHEQEASIETPESAPAPAPVKRGRPKKNVAPVAPVVPQEDDEEDELDSYEVRAATSSSNKSSIPVKAPTRGRKKAVVVKQEPEEAPEEEENPAPLATTRGGRAVKAAANAAAKTPAARTPASATTTTVKVAKPRGRPKTPASAPAAGPAAASRIAVGSAANTAGSEKENTPGTGSGSVGSDDAEDAPVKIRVSRRTGAATGTGGAAKTTKTATKSATKSTAKSATRSKVKVEEDRDSDQDVGTGRGRTTRVMRTRTKTG